MDGRQTKIHKLPPALVTLTCPAVAFAHQDASAAAGLVSGLHHPVSGLDHILAMVCVGLWGAQLGAPAVWVLPVAFPMMMAVGGFMGLIGIPLPGVEVGIALSAIVLGAMVVGKVRPPLWAASILVGIFAIFHGHAHGTELPEGASGLLYSLGFVISTGLLHAAGIGLGLVHRWEPGKVAIRVAGAVIIAGGVLFLMRTQV